ncbi:MAG: hypothetical protein HYZ26_03465 [Chloroflexi bacterium]|nr:hypothetical protein [Chloroflexota bacterium]
MLDDLDFEETPQDEGPPPEESSNRTFLMVAAGLGGFMLLAVICMVVYAVFLRPGADQAEDPAVLTAEAQNAQIAQSLTETAIAASFSPTPSNTPPPTATQPAVSPTSGLGAVTDTPGGGAPGPTADPRTATVQALLTQASIAQTQAASNIVTVTATSTAVGTLPDTGFLDDAGLPVLAGLTAMLLVVIFAARRLRAANE